MTNSNTKVTGFTVRSDKGEFTHMYDEPMYIADSKAFVTQMTYGHKDVLAKHFVANSASFIPH